jgi:F-type H+-transporting ATPase subunit epsilon
MPLTLQLITPERVVFSEEGVDSVTLPGADGELTVLPSHAPLISALASGPLTFRRGGEEYYASILGGFLEVRDDKVIVLADDSERSEEIDSSRADAARERARQAMASHDAAIDMQEALAALQRAQARLRVVERQRRSRRGPPSPPIS